ncbi:hypothetical protein D1872_304950 [compost metagenome]
MQLHNLQQLLYDIPPTQLGDGFLDQHTILDMLYFDSDLRLREIFFLRVLHVCDDYGSMITLYDMNQVRHIVASASVLYSQ